MIPPSFDYIVPKTLSEAVTAVGQHENAKILADRQSLMPSMRFQLAETTAPVDLNHVEIATVHFTNQYAGTTWKHKVHLKLALRLQVSTNSRLSAQDGVLKGKQNAIKR